MKAAAVPPSGVRVAPGGRLRPTRLRRSPRRALHRSLAIHAPAIGLIALLTVLLSTQMLLQPHLLDFWTPAEIALAWLNYLCELSVLAAMLAAAYAAVDRTCRRQGGSRPWRLACMAIVFYAVAFVFVFTTLASRSRFAVMPDWTLALSGALRWAVFASYIVAVQSLFASSRETDAKALAAQSHGAALEQQRQQLRLQLLEAQIEPHFLFNTLANVRRLYHKEPHLGAQMMASLKRYLAAALPGVRRDGATLADELALVRAYLELISMRMGSRLAFSVGDPGPRGEMAMPPMIVLTLVENAIRHGIEPSPGGGRVDVNVETIGSGRLVIRVRDTGVGLGGAHSGGTGVGLANIRSQLLAHFGPTARLRIASAGPGVLASIELSAAPAP